MTSLNPLLTESGAQISGGDRAAPGFRADPGAAMAKRRSRCWQRVSIPEA